MNIYHQVKMKKNKKIITLLGLVSLITIIQPTKQNKDIHIYQKKNTIESINNNPNLDKISDLIISDLNLQPKSNILTDLKQLTTYSNLNYDYSTYISTLTGNYLTIPNLDDFIPQGIAIYEDYILFSAYNPNSNISSCIYTLDKDSNLLNICSLDNSSHVGGITYDEDNNLLWVTVNKGLSAYPIEDIITKQNTTAIYQDKKIEDNNCSFITYYNNKLYIGTYRKNNTSTLRQYNIPILNTKEINLTQEKEITIPPQIQGATFLEYNNNKYLILSSSYSSTKNSTLTIYNYSDNIDEYTDNPLLQINCPPMLEEICLNNNKELLSIYESCSTSYQNSPSHINHIYYGNIKKLIKDKKE